METIHGILDWLLIGWTFWVFSIVMGFWTWGCFRSNDTDAQLWGGAVLIALLSSIVYGTTDLKTWFAQDWLLHIGYVAGGYIVIGFFVAGINWSFMLKRYRELVREQFVAFRLEVTKGRTIYSVSLGFEQGAESKLSAIASKDEFDPLQGGTEKAFNLYLYNHIDDMSPATLQESRLPRAELHIGRVRPVLMGRTITLWWAMWPFALIDTILDPLYMMFSRLFRMFSRLFTQLRDSLAGDVSKIL